MGDNNEKVDKSEAIEKPDLVECRNCGYHYQKNKKCPQCSMKDGT